ncbi:hypothetical protein [Paraclostridium bifermentans]|nr:hypothetical protein [Paraclostridium bifermentans]
MNVDKTYVLNKGQVVESGSHEELLSKKGVYYNIFQRTLSN